MSGMGAGALERCVGDVGRFADEHWGTRPLLNAGRDGFDDLLSLADLEHILSSMALRTPAFRLVKDGTSLDPKTYTKSGRTGSTPISGLADPGRIYDHFRRGATIVLQGMQRYWLPVTRFCRRLDLALGHPTQTNAYITPPGARGLAVHSDTHDVFVLQSFGRKRWQVWDTGANARRSEPTLEVELAPGDAMYLPVGTPHAASTQEVVSGHLTVGVLCYSWNDVVQEMVKLASREPEMRERLPVAFHRHRERFESEAQARVHDLGAWLDKQDPSTPTVAMLRRLFTSRTPILEGVMAGVIELDRIADGARVRLREDAVCELAVDEGRLLVFLGDRELRMPAWLRPVMETIRERGALAVEDLSPFMDEESRLVLVRRLVREGLLEVEGAG